MPYFIYKITERPIRMLQKLEQHQKYRDASTRVKALRSELPDDVKYVIKMFFAETEFDAEDMLNQVREAAPELADD